MVTYRAETALPYEHLERATAGLRAELRHQAADDGRAPDWSTLTVTGPTQQSDARGVTWWVYEARVQPDFRG